MHARPTPGRSLLGFALLALAACSGSSGTPNTPGTMPPATTPPTTQPAAAVGSPAPGNGAAANCRYGKGTVDTHCSRQGARFLADVDAAISDLARQQPQLFNFANEAGPGGYLVVDEGRFVTGVVRNLEARDFCAAYDKGALQLKNSNEFSEQYDILVSTGHVRRGDGAYRSTCNPPAFPLDPEDVIDSVRVAFFGFRCPDNVTPPRNGEGKLPVGCFGNVTATPKTRDNRDVDPDVHGDQIQWSLRQEGNHVRMDDLDHQAFNKALFALEKGHFTLCAVVREVEGCLNGEVVVP